MTEILFAATSAGSLIEIPWKSQRIMPEVEQSSIVIDTSFVDFVVRAFRSWGAKAIVVSAPAM